MQRLLNEPVYHRRYPERSDPARWLWDIDSSYRSRQITAFQQGDLHAWPVHLQPVFELGYRYIIDARRSFVLNHPLIRQLQVAAFDHLFHEPVVLPFRSPGCRRAKLRTPSISARLLAGTLRRGHPCGCFCFIASLRDHPSYSRLRCSALRRYRLVWPEPFSPRTPKARLQISPGITHLLSRLCASDIRYRVPYMYRALQTPLSASCSSRQRFASGFLPTLGHPRNRCLPLTLAHVGCVEHFHLQAGAPCRAHPKKMSSRVPGRHFYHSN